MTSAANEQDRKGGGARRRRALVTGASSGIGAAFAERLAGQGYDLVLVSRSGDLLRALADKLRGSAGVEVEVLAADLTKSDEFKRVEERAAAAGLELLVNNAGFGTNGAFARLDPAMEEEEIRLNVIALVRLSRAVLPGMIERGSGALINVSSIAGFQPGPFNATYCATKAFVNSFTESIQEEIRGKGVRVQALCPGFTRTGFQARAGVNAAVVPDAIWMTAHYVVDASLRSLAKDEVFCIPGRHYQAAVALSAITPRAVLRRIAGAVTRKL